MPRSRDFPRKEPRKAPQTKTAMEQALDNAGLKKPTMYKCLNSACTTTKEEGTFWGLIITFDESGGEMKTGVCGNPCQTAYKTSIAKQRERQRKKSFQQETRA